MAWVVRFMIAAAPAVAQWFYTPVVLRFGALQALLSFAVFAGFTLVLVLVSWGLGTDERPHGRLAGALACRRQTISAGSSGSPDGGHDPRCAAFGHSSGRRGRCGSMPEADELSAILARTPSTSDPAEPLPGAWCRACQGTRWWTERRQPRGWRCLTCHPPAHLPASEVRRAGDG